MNRKEFIIILIVTFFVIMVWIVAEIIHTKPSVEVDPKIQGLIEPINPNFDQTILDQVKNAGQSSPSAQIPNP